MSAKTQDIDEKKPHYLRKHQEPQQPNGQILSQSYQVFRKPNSQKSQYIFISCLVGIPYDPRILFFLDRCLSFLKKQTKKDILHSFLFKKKKLHKAKNSIFWFYFLFRLLSFLLKTTTSFPAAAILSPWIN